MDPRLLPTLNPFTGKKFASDEERDAFVADQQEKLQQSLNQNQEREVFRREVREKLREFFLFQDFSSEEVDAVFEMLRLPRGN